MSIGSNLAMILVIIAVFTLIALLLRIVGLVYIGPDEI